MKEEDEDKKEEKGKRKNKVVVKDAHTGRSSLFGGSTVK